MNAASATLDRLHEGPSLALGFAGSVLWVDVRSAVALEEARSAKAALEAHFAANPRRVVVIHAVREAASRPQGETRECLRELMSLVAPHTDAWSLHVAGEGVTATVKRTFARLLLSFASFRGQSRVFSDLAEAVDWGCQHAGVQDSEAVHEAFQGPA